MTGLVFICCMTSVLQLHDAFNTMEHLACQLQAHEHSSKNLSIKCHYCCGLAEQYQLPVLSCSHAAGSPVTVQSYAFMQSPPDLFRLRTCRHHKC